MADMIKFNRGLLTSLPVERDSNTLYFGYSVDGKSGQLWLGNNLIAEVNDTDTSAVNGLISTALANYYTKEQVDGLLKEITDDLAEIDYSGKADKVTGAVAGNFASLDANGNLVDSGKKAGDFETAGAAAGALDDAKDYTDAEIEGLEFALSEDGKTLELKNKTGTAVATLDTSEFVVDGMLSSVVADEANNKLTFTWNTDSGIQVTEIALSSIADIYTGSTGTNVNISVSNQNVISADLTDTVKTDIAKGVTAHGWGNHADAGYMKTTDHETFVNGNAALQSGITAEKVGQYDTVKETVDTNKATWDKAGTAVQSVTKGTANGTIKVDGGEDIQVTDLSNYATKDDIANFGGGDMLKSVYDTNDNGIVDNAEKLENKTLAEVIAAAQEGLATTNDLAEAEGRAAEDASNKVAVALADAQSYADAIKSAITGGSTETIANVVKAINSIYNGTAATDAVVNNMSENLTAVAEEVDTINEALTWGSF